jgi:hypothetical protein
MEFIGGKTSPLVNDLVAETLQASMRRDNKDIVVEPQTLRDVQESILCMQRQLGAGRI